jgi:hypothetical protein
MKWLARLGEGNPFKAALTDVRTWLASYWPKGLEPVVAAAPVL